MRKGSALDPNVDIVSMGVFSPFIRPLICLCVVLVLSQPSVFYKEIFIYMPYHNGGVVTFSRKKSDEKCARALPLTRM